MPKEFTVTPPSEPVGSKRLSAPFDSVEVLWSVRKPQQVYSTLQVHGVRTFDEKPRGARLFIKSLVLSKRKALYIAVARTVKTRTVLVVRNARHQHCLR